MKPKYNYSHFKVFVMEDRNGYLSENQTFDNLKYKDALRLFKQTRQALESNDLHSFPLSLFMVGITINGEVIEKHKVEFNPSYKNDTSNNHLEIEESLPINISTSNKEDNFAENDALEMVDSLEKYIDNFDSSEFVSIGELFSEFDFSNIQEEEECKENIISTTNNICSSSKAVLDNTNNNASLSEYPNKDNANMYSLSDIDLNKCFKHISEVKAKDIVNILIQALHILDKKNSYILNMNGYFDKKRDYLYHKYENINSYMHLDSSSFEEELISIGKEMVELSTKRRDIKDDRAICERTFQILPRIKPKNIETIEQLRFDKSYFDSDFAPNLKIYSYTYNDEIERDDLMKSLSMEFDKVLDVEWGLIECYNRVGSIKARKKTTSVLKKRVLEFKDIDISTANSFEGIVSSTVPVGESFVKSKGTSVKITHIDRQHAYKFAKDIYTVYKDVAYNEETKSLYLIERLKS